jgi:two-component system, sensor histidine kinase and response regulator
MKILLVEDDADIRDSIQEFFTDEGFEVAIAGNGVEALEAMQHELPSVVVLDLMMPVMDGVTFYHRMQAEERFKTVPVVVSTSDPSRAPAGTVIVRKPIDLRMLSRIVRSLGPVDRAKQRS